MKIKLPVAVFSVLLVISLLIISCGTTTTTSSTTPSSTPATTKITTSTAASTTQANWWDKWGEPQYGGTITYRGMSTINAYNLDPSNPIQMIAAPLFDNLIINDWTVDPDEWFYIGGAEIPLEYWEGQLMESWEQTDPQTVTVHLRKGIYWHDKAPTNGRELNADDIAFNYDRVLGTGSGFTQPNPFSASSIANVQNVVAVDKYTVQFNMKNANVLSIFDLSGDIRIGAPESTKVEGGLTDTELATGTGAWLLTDYVVGSSVTCVRNPNYYAYDERYPKNKLPYADSVRFLQITDKSTALTALRTYKIDYTSGITVADMESVKRTNPDIQWRVKLFEGMALVPRVDHEPFTDIKVRKAMQMAIDLSAIAKSHYGGVVDGNPDGILNPVNHKGWFVPYEEWPQSLKDEYSYNPTAAKQLLADAGYPDGFSTNCVCNTAQDLELLQILQSFLGDVGIDMELVNLNDMPTYMPYVFAGKHDQIAYFQWSARGWAAWRELNNLTKGQNLNLSRVDDPEYEAIMASLNNAKTIDEAKKICKEANTYVLQKHWIISTFANPTPCAIQQYLKGCTAEESTGYPFARWWVDQTLKDSIAK